MSSYLKVLKNPKTGKDQLAYCIDDFYGSHIYGYGFRRDGHDADWDVKHPFDYCDFYKWEDVKE